MIFMSKVVYQFSLNSMRWGSFMVVNLPQSSEDVGPVLSSQRLADKKSALQLLAVGFSFGGKWRTKTFLQKSAPISFICDPSIIQFRIKYSISP